MVKVLVTVAILASVVVAGGMNAATKMHSIMDHRQAQLEELTK